jgi:hypothetical protein
VKRTTAGQVTVDHTGSVDRNSVLLVALQDAKADAYSCMLEQAEMEGGYDDHDIISVNSFQAIRVFAVRVTPIFTSKIHALNT